MIRIIIEIDDKQVSFTTAGPTAGPTAASAAASDAGAAPGADAASSKPGEDSKSKRTAK
jgi:hypothetical protein